MLSAITVARHVLAEHGVASLAGRQETRQHGKGGGLKPYPAGLCRGRSQAWRWRGLEVVDALRAARPNVHVVMLTGYGNIATAMAAVKAGAIDYLPKPADADQITAALLSPGRGWPPPPENPMSAHRVRWEHIQRVYEQCERNVSETARRLNMHRRTLQHILPKRAPSE